MAPKPQSRHKRRVDEDRRRRKQKMVFGQSIQKFKNTVVPLAKHTAANTVHHTVKVDTRRSIAWRATGQNNYTGSGKRIFDTRGGNIGFNLVQPITYMYCDDFSCPPWHCDKATNLADFPNETNVVLDGAVRGGGVMLADNYNCFEVKRNASRSIMEGTLFNGVVYNKDILYQHYTRFTGTECIRFGNLSAAPGERSTTKFPQLRAGTAAENTVTSLEVMDRLRLRKFFKFRVRKVGLWLPHCLDETTLYGLYPIDVDPYHLWNQIISQEIFQPVDGKPRGLTGRYSDLSKPINSQIFRTWMDRTYTVEMADGLQSKRTNASWCVNLEGETHMMYGNYGWNSPFSADADQDDSVMMMKSCTTGLGLTSQHTDLADTFNGYSLRNNIQASAPVQLDDKEFRGRRPAVLRNTEQQEYFSTGWLLEKNRTDNLRFGHPKNKRWCVIDIIRFADPGIDIDDFNHDEWDIGYNSADSDILAQVKEALEDVSICHLGVKDHCFHLDDKDGSAVLVNDPANSKDNTPAGDEFVLGVNDGVANFTPMVVPNKTSAPADTEATVHTAMEQEEVAEHDADYEDGPDPKVPRYSYD